MIWDHDHEVSTVLFSQERYTRTSSPLSENRFSQPTRHLAANVAVFQAPSPLAACLTLFHRGERADSLSPAHPTKKAETVGSTS